ncbi:MAG TPA: serine/threonine-protein kinase [Polyangia bacterium]|nr:serine/threonine-protein kinase [Polyangia bacterium]
MTDVETEFRRLGPYVLLRASGAGGMARIDLALRGDPSTADVCVLKRLHADYRSPEQEARFRREAAIARRLSHDAIARTLDIDEIDGEILLLQELVMGVDLRRLAARVTAVGEPLPVALAVYVVSEVARALDYAHAFRRLGIVHRDVTPDNIMLAFSGAVKLVDFGIARSNADGTLTQAGFVVGRPVYTAPEVWNGARADRRSDIYSLGVVLWQLLAGRPLELADVTTSPAQINPAVPTALAAINLRAFDADPAHRFQFAGALQRSLAPYLPNAAEVRAQLAALLARHFDVPREQRMLAEDVAHAIPLLAAGKTPPASPKSGRSASRNRLLLWTAVALVLFDGALWKASRIKYRRSAAPPAPVVGTRSSPVPPTPPVAAAKVAFATPSDSPSGKTQPPPAAITQAADTPAAPPPQPAATFSRKAASARPTRERTRAGGEHPAVQTTAADPRKLLAEAQLDFDRGDLALSLALARQAAHDGAGAPAYVLIGTIMMNEHRDDEAERAFTQATLCTPTDPRADRLLALVREIRKMGAASQ